jgi:glycine/D-amino acid oxidase-like deaminating enzyme
MYDLIIIGAGLAGLRVGIEVLKRKKGLRVAILEKYNYVGGRVVTHYKDGLQWEIGAGRISEKHKLVLGLMRKYGLTWVPHGNGGEDEFSVLKEAFFQPLSFLTDDILSGHTLFEIMAKVHGEAETQRFFSLFPYWGEVHTMRADMALSAFREEMKSFGGFGGCKEGLSAICRAMAREFRQLGGRIFLDSQVIEIRRADGVENIYLSGGDIIKSRVCVMALHRDAVAGIRGVSTWSGIRHLKMDPLLRMYAVFPGGPGGAWFGGLPKVVTAGRLRFVIPVNSLKGIIMISYTDGKDALYWMNMMKKRGKDVVIGEVMKDIRQLFADRIIPDPLDFKLYPWDNGCTYWLPGSYDPREESKAALCVRDGLFCCGESWSLRQAWMEGALEHADMLLGDSRFRSVL